MKKKSDIFQNKELPPRARKRSADIDLDALYERANDELSLQQSKRDQIITIYLAMFSFLVPFALSMDGQSWMVKGFIFLAAAVIGVLFSFIIIRYRVYKEVYWLCCQSITVLMGIRNDKMNKETVQAVYYQSMKKKGIGYIKELPNGKKKFRRLLYVKKNLFSSETIYFLIHTFITSVLFGLSVALISTLDVIISAPLGIIAGLILLVVLTGKYFSQCEKVYSVLADDTDKSFNFAFGKAWFLHFYV